MNKYNWQFNARRMICRLGKNILVGENVGEPIRYIPRWPLDQSGVDYFPGSHRSHKSATLNCFSDGGVLAANSCFLFARG
jgi:hypothetical protein